MHQPVVEHHGAIGELTCHVEGVRDEHDRPALLLERPHPVEAPALERLVTDGEHLVDQEHLRVDVHGAREPQPNEHPGGVELHRPCP